MHGDGTCVTRVEFKFEYLKMSEGTAGLGQSWPDGGLGNSLRRVR